MIIADDIPDVECSNCGWMGDTDRLMNGRCPECDSADIVNYDFEAEQEPWPPGDKHK